MRYTLTTTRGGHMIAVPARIVRALVLSGAWTASMLDSRTLIQLPGAFFPKRG